MDRRIEKIISHLTLEEKAGLCSGEDFWHTKAVERLDMPEIMMCDGPHGLRKQTGIGDHLGLNKSVETVCYPTAAALAASFDTELMRSLGEALGKECQAEEVGMLLGPGLNMKRSPLNGRNFEYFSEDPYLAGKLAASYVNALQEQGIAACVKHFAANNQETMRMSGSSNIDERSLREIYLAAFEIVVKEANTRSVMCAYNAINNIFCSENKWLLTDVLREEWGFDGFVVTDWGAIKDPVEGIKAGLDLIMPGGSEGYATRIIEAIQSGELKEEELNRVVANIIKFVMDCQELKKEDAVIDREQCRLLSEEMITQCAILMKNEAVLPLKKSAKVAIIGEFAEAPRYQGSGSSFVNVPKLAGALEHIADVTGQAKATQVTYAKGYYTKQVESDDKLLLEAVDAAKNADYAVIYAGLPGSFETEGADRRSMDIPENQNTLIDAVSRVQPNTIVVLHGGSPMTLPWIDRVKAVLCMYLGGQEVGRASLRLLYGDVNPSGKLAETWPIKLSDNPSYLNFPGRDGIVDYSEGVYIGYRYYDKKEMAVCFPFGHGLSYSRFEYEDLTVSKEKISDTESLWVSCKVKNAGTVTGKEVIQLYIRDEENEVSRPIRELKGFAKIELAPGEEKKVVFELDKRSFAYYETLIHDWHVSSGAYTIEIGSSSRDIRLIKAIEVNGTVELPYVYHEHSPLSSLRKTARGRKVMKVFEDKMDEMEMQITNSNELGDGRDVMVEAQLYEMPLSGLVSFGALSEEQMQEVLRDLQS